MTDDSPKYVHYECTPATFRPHTRHPVRWLDWERDYALARTIWPDESPLTRETWLEASELGYRYCGAVVEHPAGAVVQHPAGAVVEHPAGAVVQHPAGEPRLLAIAAVWRYSETAWEAAAVRTRPDARRRGYAKAVLSFVTAFILDSGRRATCTTGRANLAMQKTAESIGFVQIAT